MRPESARDCGDVLDGLIAALGHDLRGAELSGQPGSVGIAAQDDDLLGPEPFRGGVMPGAHHVGHRQERGDERVVSAERPANSVPSACGIRSASACAPPLPRTSRKLPCPHAVRGPARQTHRCHWDRRMGPRPGLRTGSVRRPRSRPPRRRWPRGPCAGRHHRGASSDTATGRRPFKQNTLP